MRNPTALGSFNPTQQKTGSRAIEKPCAYWPSKSSMRIQKPFRMISLRTIRQQLPWIDILTKNTGGWGYVPFSNPPVLTNAAARGPGSNRLPPGGAYRTPSTRHDEATNQPLARHRRPPNDFLDAATSDFPVQARAVRTVGC